MPCVPLCTAEPYVLRGAVQSQTGCLHGDTLRSALPSCAPGSAGGDDEAQSAWLLSPEVSVDDVQSSWEAVGRLYDRALEQRVRPPCHRMRAVPAGGAERAEAGRLPGGVRTLCTTVGALDSSCMATSADPTG